ncbi:hypothetical protein KY366_04520 [Candidatus Woesearchaeota archaeon]|nr:hypothetical protein [Candidatus Woesearchaeota archaeon]
MEGNKMIKLEDWDKKKVQEESNAEVMKLHGGYLGFIEKKLGKDAVMECVSDMAEQEADMLKKMPSKEKGALKVAISQGTHQKNLCGSENVKVEGDKDKAIVSIGKCTALKTTRKFMEMGVPMTEETCCAGCKGVYANLAKSMGIKNSDFVRTDDGCKYVYSRD